MPPQLSSRDLARSARYENVLALLVSERQFVLSDAQQACGGERPGFVTRVVRALEREGHLEQVGSRAAPAYRWQRDPQEFSGAAWIEGVLCGARLARTPPAERPRERLLARGAASLRTAELLAILVRSGRPGESALQAGEKIVARYTDDLSRLAAASRAALSAVSPAVRDAAYCQIMAGIELGRRVAASDARSAEAEVIRGPEEAIAFCRRAFARLATDAAQEEFHIVTLGTRHQVLATHQITVGTLDASLVHPREVFRPALQDAAAAVILVHNHPSGDPSPSRHDLEVTDRLDEAALALDIDLLDHIIVARSTALSIRSHQADRSHGGLSA